MNNNKYSSHVPRRDFLFNKLWKQTFFPPCLPLLYNGWLLPLNMLIINVVWKYNKLRKQTFLFATSLECLDASLWLLSQYKNLACLFAKFTTLSSSVCISQIRIPNVCLHHASYSTHWTSEQTLSIDSGHWWIFIERMNSALRDGWMISYKISAKGWNIYEITKYMHLSIS